MFACPSTADGVLGVHPVWQYNVDHIDLGVIGDLIIGFVGVAIPRRDLVFVLPCLDLGWGATDDTCQATMLGFLKSRCDLIGTQAPSPTNA